MNERKLFGTDGIRGVANIYPMTCEVALKLGRAVTSYFQKKSKRKRPLIILGKDTRRSCYMLEQAFSAGVCSQGGQVILTGPLPTPGVAFVTKSMRADAGVMISASHNSYFDNGIKLFDSQGYKLPDEVEIELEEMIFDSSLIPTQTGPDLGHAKRLDEVIGRYIVNTKSVFPENYNLDGMRVVLDCANGAAYKVAPMILDELGAEVFSIGISPNGVNINDNCGSLYPETCMEAIGKYRSDMGICLDGDADRVVIIDENAKQVEGDVLIGILAKLLLARGTIKEGDTVVGTVMSNLGLEQYLKSIGLKFQRTKVGDRYIMDYMKSGNAILGGEPSGHIILKDHSTTGDGMMAALKLIEATKFFNKSFQELISEITLFPQNLTNIKVRKKVDLKKVDKLQKQIKESEQQLGNNGRLLIRYSGTEPLLRIMVEGKDSILINEITEKLKATILELLG